MTRPVPARFPLGLAALLILSACSFDESETSFPTLAGCAGDEAVETRLYFGLSRGSGAAVTPGDWSGFVGQVVAPAFSNGFTVLEGDGYWHDAGSGYILRESSHVVVRVHPGDAEDERRIAHVIARYKRTFGQQSVLRTDTPVCARF